MSMDHTGPRGDNAHGAGSTDPVTDAPLMAATPIWETRGKKRRGLGRGAAASGAAAATTSVAAEPRSFDSPMDQPRTHTISETRPMTEPSMASAAAVTDPMTGRPDMTDHTHATHTTADDGDAGLVAPIGRTRSRTQAAPARRSGMPVAAIAAGVVALGAVGAAGWYATRTNDGVAELTPGAAQESMAVAQAPPTPAAPLTASTSPAAVGASTTPPSAPAATSTATTTASATTERRATVRTASASRTRPATAASAPSASEAGINASGTATIPAGPQPYSALNPGASTDTATTGATGSSGVTTAPSTTPAPMPSTPPIVSDPAPSVASPTAPSPTTATPPTGTTPQ